MVCHLVGSSEALVHHFLVRHFELLDGRVVELEPPILVAVRQRMTASLLNGKEKYCNDSLSHEKNIHDFDKRIRIQ
jgi:hypothetical protein